MSACVETAIIRLLRTHPFYGQLLSRMNRKYTKDIPTAGVSLEGGLTLHINNDFFKQLTDSQQLGVLIHEANHILDGHIVRAIKLSGKFNKALNIAADRANNEQIEKLTNRGTVVAEVPDSFTIKMNGEDKEVKPITRKNFQENFPDEKIKDNETMEYYYKFLKEQRDKNKGKGEPGSGEGSDPFDGDLLDDHEMWTSGDVSEEEAKELTKKALNDAAKAAGNVPGDILSKLEKWNKPSLSWKQLLRRFVQQETSMESEFTRKKPNRRTGIINPGTKVKPKMKLGIAVDTSGSVSDGYLKQFFAEINAISNLGIDIYVVLADCTVQDAFKYDKRKPVQVKGRGGTAFQPAIDALHKIDCSAIIYLTDGETFSETPISKKPILWVLCPSYTIPTGWKEKDTVKIPSQEKR